MIFNSLPWARRDIVEAGVILYGDEDPADSGRYEMYRIVDADGNAVPFQELEGRQTAPSEVRFAFVASGVPANGYAAYYLMPRVPEAEAPMPIQAPGAMSEAFPEPTFVIDDVEERISVPYRGVRVGRRFASPFYLLDVDEVTGRVSVVDRRTDRVLVEGMHLAGAEETMREGLSRYDYTGRRFEVAVDRVDLEESGEVRATLLVAGRLLSSPVEQRFRVYGGLDRVDVEVRLWWGDAKPVRVQMVFPMDVAGSVLYYGVPYGHSSLEDAMPGCEVGWGPGSNGERWPQQRECEGWIALDREGEGVALAGDRRAFEFDGEAVRGDVLRSCIDPVSYSYHRVWRTYPDSCSAQYTIRGYSGDFRDALAHRDGWALNRPMHVRSVYDTESPRGLPPRLSFVALEGPGLVTTALKAAEDGEGFVLRACETLGRPCEARLRAFRELASVCEADMLERPVGELDPACVRFSPFEIKTVRFTLQRGDGE